MALTDDGVLTTMPVAPAYNGGCNNGLGFGGDWGWIILLLLFAGGGYGMGGFGGFGGFGGYDFPWLLTGQQNINANTNGGFRDAMLNDGITSVRDGIAGIATQLCNGFANVEQGANARQMADMQQAFNAQVATMQGFNGVQGQLAQCCCDNRLATANLGSDIAREACATRTNDTQNTQAILNAVNSGVQSIKDQICNDKLDAKNDTIAQLRQELLYARGQASQDVQTATLRQSDATTANQLINELRSCPIPSMPVYGQTPIFTCNGCNGGCGCGM